MTFDLGRDLYEACERDDLPRVQEILAASLPACLNWQQIGLGWTPLQIAAAEASPAVVNCLVAAGANVNAKSSDSDDPPLQMAIHSMFNDSVARSARYDVGIAIVKLLLAAGADATDHGSNLCPAAGLARLYGDDHLARLIDAQSVNRT